MAGRGKNATASIRRGASALVLAGVLLLGGGLPANAGVDDFSYDSWDVDVQLGVDDVGRAVARITETVTPVFPDSNQNKGIVRGIPERYEGAPLHISDISVTDGAEHAVPFETESEDGYTVILVGDDSYVHGRQTYAMSYTVRDPVIAAEDTKVDEFYWDLLNLERAQPVDSFTATITLDETLSKAVTGDASCYWGEEDSTDTCPVTQGESDGHVTYSIDHMPLAAYEGVTVAIDMQPGTVTQPSERRPNALLDVGPIVVGGVNAVLAALSIFFVTRMRRRSRVASGVIVAQYDVPADLPPLVAGPVVGKSDKVIPAEFLHLAVQGAMQIEEVAPKNGRKPLIAFRLLDRAKAGSALDARALRVLFGKTAEAGTLKNLPRRSDSFAKKMTALQGAGVKEAQDDRGLLTRKRSGAAMAVSIVGFALVAVTVVLLIAAGSRGNAPALSLGVMGACIALVGGIIGVVKHRVHTPKGAEVREYLLGVKEFITVAETDRLQMLQSYQGADRRADGSVDVVHLYEKLLPYAELFGEEKSWAKQLMTQYEAAGVATVYWYSSLHHHGIAGIGDALGRFSSAMNSSASYTSSSSGGSTGGGFSGGGGGGGFSGGR
ncbi:MAG: DUF2207 domain-containing protein [Microbacterium sp.]